MGSNKYNSCELRPNMLYKLFPAYLLASSLQIIGDELQQINGCERAAEALSRDRSTRWIVTLPEIASEPIWRPNFCPTLRRTPSARSTAGWQTLPSTSPITSV